MESFKKLLMTYFAFMAKTKNILLFTLAMSILLNLVLFLRIPLNTKSDIMHAYSEETFAGLFEEQDPRELFFVENHSGTNKPYDNERIENERKSLEVI